MKPLSLDEARRNRDFNAGYSTGWEDGDIDLEKYETNEAYRRGYDAGERDRDEDALGDHDPMSPDESIQIYGDEKDTQ